MLQNFLIIVFLHYIADWGLQNDFMANNKGKYWEVMFAHCMVWSGAISLGLMYLHMFSVAKLVWLFGGHWAMDYFKINLLKPLPQLHPENEKYNLTLLRIDQSFHILQCITVILP